MLLGHPLPEAPGPSAEERHGEVFFNGHFGRGAHERVLEDPADPLPPAVLGEVGHIEAVDDDVPVVDQEAARDHVEERRLPGAVAADDGDEIARGDVKADLFQGDLLVDGPPVEDLGDAFELKHGFARGARDGPWPVWSGSSQRPPPGPGAPLGLPEDPAHPDPVPQGGAAEGDRHHEPRGELQVRGREAEP